MVQFVVSEILVACRTIVPLSHSLENFVEYLHGRPLDLKEFFLWATTLQNEKNKNPLCNAS